MIITLLLNNIDYGLVVYKLLYYYYKYDLFYELFIYYFVVIFYLLLTIFIIGFLNKNINNNDLFYFKNYKNKFLINNLLKIKCYTNIEETNYKNINTLLYDSKKITPFNSKLYNYSIKKSKFQINKFKSFGKFIGKSKCKKMINSKTLDYDLFTDYIIYIICYIKLKFIVNAKTLNSITIVYMPKSKLISISNLENYKYYLENNNILKKNCNININILFIKK